MRLLPIVVWVAVLAACGSPTQDDVDDDGQVAQGNSASHSGDRGSRPGFVGGDFEAAEADEFSTHREANATSEELELNPGWIGGACASASNCNAKGYTARAQCQREGFPNGFCTQTCSKSGSSYYCPDAASVGGSSGNTPTRCISANGNPQCVAECDFNQSSPNGCRPGYRCVVRQRFNQSSKLVKVCMPEPEQRWPGEAAPPDDIGASCTKDASCGHNICMEMGGNHGNYCSKLMCDSAGCPGAGRCFEVALNYDLCFKNCASDSDCRASEGYFCDPKDKMCIPKNFRGEWNPDVGAADCKQAWGDAGEKLSPCDKTKDDYVVVRKSARNMAVCKRGELVKNLRSGLGSSAVGDKVQQGDAKTPEGVFYVAQRLPQSKYYKALLLSYPDKADAERGLSAGIISRSEKKAIDTAQTRCAVPPQGTKLGGFIEVHGHGSATDWTLGCVALDNESIDLIWANMAVGDSIVVYP